MQKETKRNETFQKASYTKNDIFTTEMLYAGRFSSLANSFQVFKTSEEEKHRVFLLKFRFYYIHTLGEVN